MKYTKEERKLIDELIIKFAEAASRHGLQPHYIVYSPFSEEIEKIILDRREFMKGEE